MNRTAHQCGRLALLLAGAIVAAFPATAAADETPIDPALPTPTLPAGADCGSASSPTWRTVSSPPPAGMTISIGGPRPTVNGVTYQGVAHAWDVDGSQAADGSVPGSPGVREEQRSVAPRARTVPYSCSPRTNGVPSSEVSRQESSTSTSAAL